MFTRRLAAGGMPWAGANGDSVCGSVPPLFVEKGNIRV